VIEITADPLALAYRIEGQGGTHDGFVCRQFVDR
jgi:hypothetical protein